MGKKKMNVVRKRTSSKEAEGENTKKRCIRIIMRAVFLRLKITD